MHDTSIPIAIGIGLLLVVLIAEIVLSLRWNQGYFTVGLPIFVRRLDRPQGLGDVSLDDLQRSAATVAGTPILFRRLGPDLIAFREKGLGGSMHYAPLMRGVIRYTTGEPSASVLGLVNWTALAFPVVLVVLLRRAFIDIAPWFGGLYAIIYLVQSVRYARVAKALRYKAPMTA